MGYYFGRDYGNVYLENREMSPPGHQMLRHIAYTPRLVLRDAWHLAHYMNLNQLQLSIQDIDRVQREFSNASEHTHDYCFAMLMMGIPLFFQETQRLKDSARQQLRPIIKLYKEHRESILGGYVFPLGDEPDDHSWSGFQSHDVDSGGGYVTLFRELYNGQPERAISLRLLAAGPLTVTDLLTGEAVDVELGRGGEMTWRIDEPGRYAFLRYAPKG